MIIFNNNIAILILVVMINIFPSGTPLSFDFASFPVDNDDNIIYDLAAKASNNIIKLTEYQSNGIDTPEWSIGRATYAQPLHLWNKSSGKLADFTTRFSFSIKNLRDQVSKGGGLAFFLVPYNSSSPLPDQYVAVPSFGLTNDALNSAINHFVAVEFDPFFSSFCDPPKVDDRADHVGIDINSMNSSAVKHWWCGNTIMEGTDEHRVSIDYNSESMNLKVVFTTFKDDKWSNDSLSYKVDLREYLPEFVSVGFTASNLNLSAQQNIHSWSFSSTLDLPNVNGAQPLAPTPSNSITTTVTRDKSSGKAGLIIGLSVCLLFLLVLGLLAYYCFWNKRKRRTEIKLGGPSALTVICNEVRQDASPMEFTYDDLKEATNNFAEDNKLGEGGSGSVYKGCLKRINEIIAVKRISSNSTQGLREYETEVKIISKLRHKSLVKLLGWCHEKKQELLLVYEYMPNGSLNFHLFNNVNLLSWGIRMKIAKGLASALLYLHEMCEHCVLHRDIKAANIMLDEHFNIKVGDFGLARMVDHRKGSKTSINVAGTMGYMAPEYMQTGIASKGTDVFSFGVVTLEIATGLRAIHYTEQDPVNLVEWAWSLYGTGKILEAVDPRLGSDLNEGEFSRLITLGLWCAHPDASSRPSISDVARMLDYEAPLPDLPSRMPAFDFTSFCSSVSSTTWQSK